MQLWDFRTSIFFVVLYWWEGTHRDFEVMRCWLSLKSARVRQVLLEAPLSPQVLLVLGDS